MILNVLFIFTLVCVGDSRPFAAPTPRATTTDIQNLKVVYDNIGTKDRLSTQDFSFDLPFPNNPFQTPLLNYPFPKIPGFPFPFNPFPAPPPV